MKAQEQLPIESYMDGPLYRDLLLPALIGVMVTTLLAGPIYLISMLSPGVAGFYLLLAVFVTSLEAVYTTRWFYQPDQRLLNKFAYRLAEIILLLVLARLLTWAISGQWLDLAGLYAYLLNPLLFFDPLFIIFALFTLLALERAVNLSTIFIELGLSNDEIAYYTLSPEARRMIEYEGAPTQDRATLMRRFYTQWVYGGLALAFFAILTTVDTAAWVGAGARSLRTIGRLGLPSEMLLALLLYFLVGLWLVSHGRLMVLRARWVAAGVATDQQVSGEWRRFSLLLILAVAVVAAFLPIGSTFAIGQILEAVIYVGAALVYLLVNVSFLLLAAALAWLFGPGRPADDLAEEIEPAVTLLPPVTPTAVPPDVAVSDTPALVLGGLFWVVVIIVSLIAILFFLRDRGYRMTATTPGRWWRSVVHWLRRLWRAAAGQIAQSGQTLRRRLAASSRKKTGRPRWSFFRLNALSPREQLRYFYLSTVRRAGQRGVRRAAGQTPLEYAQELERTWPEAEQEIASLTDAFLKARYAPYEIEDEEVNFIKRIWKRVRALLRRKRHE